jgi:3-phenylpropionate/trans-cinnamate dioxygenase ferredoxin subunit
MQLGTSWHQLIAEEEFPDVGKFATCVGGWFVLVTSNGEEFSAVNDRCTHQAAKLSPGMFRRGAIMCPVHGARFEAATGRCIGGAYPNLRTFEIRTAGGIIEVALPDEPPAINERPTGN